MNFVQWFKPFSAVSRKTLLILIGGQAALALLIWSLGPIQALPTPAGIAKAWMGLVTQQGLLRELWASVETIAYALVISSFLSIGIAALYSAPFFRPMAQLISSFRFLGFAGLTFLFTLAAASGFELKLALLTFGMSVFLTTNLLSEVDTIPATDIDYAKTLGMHGWRAMWELFILGRAHVSLDLIRQNAAVGWTLLSMVEGLVRSEGGIGSMLLTQNRHFNLDAVFAIQITILVYGLVQDRLLNTLRATVCPYSEIERRRQHG